MKMTNEKKAEAKEMNSKFYAFEVYSYDDGKSVFYRKFGHAYNASSKRAYNGENVALFGLTLGSFNNRQLLYCC